MSVENIPNIHLKEGRSPRVTLVGGGSGSPYLADTLNSTKLVSGYKIITSGFDSGGFQGARREERKHEIAVSDSFRALFGTAVDKTSEGYKELYELFFDRKIFTRSVVGQGISNFYFDKETGFSRLERFISNHGVELNGSVIPSSTEPSHINFITEEGREYKGEHLLDDNAMLDTNVTEMYLDPSVKAFGPAMEAIEKAQLILLSFGSFYGSVLVNGLPEGMKDAFKRFKGKMYLLTNLLSTRLENHEFTPLQFAETVEKYMGVAPDGLIVPKMTRAQFERQHPDIALAYSRERSHFLGWNDYTLKHARGNGLDIVTHNATAFVPDKDGRLVVRHDKPELAEALVEVIPAAN